MRLERREQLTAQDGGVETDILYRELFGTLELILAADYTV